MTRTIPLAGCAAALILSACSNNHSGPLGSGLVEGTQLVISAEATGRLLALYVDEGSNISEGDTIALIDTVDVALRLMQARAAKNASAAKLRMAELAVDQAAIAHDLAAKELRRIEQLMTSGTANQQQLDMAEHAFEQAGLARNQAEASLAASKAELESATAAENLLFRQFENCFPTAPTSGLISKKYVESGELIGPGRPLVELIKLDTVWVKIYLNSADIATIKHGQKAFIDIEDGSTPPLEGFVTWISDQSEFTPKNVQTKEARADLVFAVKITIANADGKLKIGMPVSVKIP